MAALGNASPDHTFEVPAKESRSYAWKLKVPDGAGLLAYKAVGPARRDKREVGRAGHRRGLIVRPSLPPEGRGAGDAGVMGRAAGNSTRA